MRTARHPSPLPPDPATIYDGSPLPPGTATIYDGSPLPPDRGRAPSPPDQRRADRISEPAVPVPPSRTPRHHGTVPQPIR